ncbi:OLC1v1032698C1 [Oldenlandia corymbosa var. corymbosa]|uniref:OLC1v1032698C1 n=1 Tax=Oldenlandia corymbosa var. corymbosa TaxID=529605 RepID=A0AAV1CN09_OLDCO|nr:OLC1v1032698C1 [Oldenlandia corymbosa var. corymbosa]
MERYTKIEEVGRGGFGVVWKAKNKQTGEIVAIKMVTNKRFETWEECINLREVKSLRRMNHPNIVKLKEVIKEQGTLYFVFEYLDFNLLHLIEHKKRTGATSFPESLVRDWCFRVFQGLAHMHERGYFHRDLKPENLLLSEGRVIKIADMGLAREIDSQPPYTEYVMTRWYRPPEVILNSPDYGPAVDMWSMGAIMAELFTLFPLFDGLDEADQMYKICCVLGTPTEKDWPEGIRPAKILNYKFPQCEGIYLPGLIPSACPDAINLIQSLCSWDPCKRPTPAQALKHPFFRSCYRVPAPLPEQKYSIKSNLKKQHPIQRPVNVKNDVVSDADNKFTKLAIYNGFGKPSQPLQNPLPQSTTTVLMEMINRWNNQKSNMCAGRSEVMLPHKKIDLPLSLC